MIKNKVISSTSFMGKRYSNRFTSFFDGYCFMCHQYGHRISNCRYMSRRYSKFHFGYSFPKMNSLRCYKCYLFGHVMHNCKTKSIQNDQSYVSLQVDKEFDTKVTKTWRPKINKCMFIQMALYSKEKYFWIIDSGFSRHMTWDRMKFNKLINYKGGNVSFGDDSSRKIKVWVLRCSVTKCRFMMCIMLMD